MRNIKTSIALLVLGSLVLLNACKAQDDKKATDKANDPVIATVNGASIYQSQLDGMLRQGAAQGAPDTPEIRKLMIEELVGRELAYQEASKQELDKKPEVKQLLNQAKQEILVRAMVQEYIKTHTPTDDQLKAEYDKFKAKVGDSQYNARHILVKTEKEARDIIAQLSKGAKFEKLASKSLDKGSAERGGELGYNTPSAYVPPFAAALKSLKKGETTKNPVQSQFGWHVIRVEDIKPTPSFEEMKPRLAPSVQQDELRKFVEGLRAKAKVDIKASATPTPAAPHGALAPTVPSSDKK